MKIFTLFSVLVLVFAIMFVTLRHPPDYCSGVMENNFNILTQCK